MWISGGAIATQDYIFKNMEFAVTRMVFLTGMFGVIFYFFILAIAHYFDCPMKEICDENGYIEDFHSVILMLYHDKS